MENKYKIIYLDPPWEYKVWSNKGKGRSAESHYNTQSTDFISNMNIESLADKDCALLMWATMPCLPDAIKLGEKLGFTYKTCAFTWVKTNKHNLDPFVGMGYYSRSNAELCLLFTKGKPLNRVSKSVKSVVCTGETVVTPIGKHSQKPHEVRKRIVELFGNVKRVEVFARTREGMFGDVEYDGWDVFGNEVNNSIKI